MIQNITLEKSDPILGLVGKLIFIGLCSKYKNDLEEYLAIMKIDRLNANNIGINPHEYSLIFRTTKEQDNFVNNFDDVKPTQYLQYLRTI
jgi:hypothetical protein